VLDGYHLFHAARADLLRRLGRRDEAARAYGRALELASNQTERAFLTRRLAEVRADGQLEFPDDDATRRAAPPATPRPTRRRLH
jgi:RNA polymerase sigma-70 factor (ECF subfamily)